MMMLLLFLLSSLFLSVNLENSCRTPNNEDGYCVLIGDCPSLLSILKERPLNQSAIEFLKKSNCGYQYLMPKVCCPDQLDETPVSSEEKDEDVNFKQNNALENIEDDNSTIILQNLPECGLVVDDRIIGGQIADLDEFPWLALLEYLVLATNESVYNCVGTLINHRYIVTAAHCLLPRLGQKLVGVRLGEYNLETEIDCVDVPFSQYCAPPTLNIQIEQFFIHENFNGRRNRITYGNNQHDIGLVKLAEFVPFSHFIQPSCLPISESIKNKTFFEKSVFVTGWGKTEFLGPRSNVKLKVELPIVKIKECNKVYAAEIGASLNINHICAGGIKNKDSCQGDSGAPLMVINIDKDGEARWFTVGIVSFGKACGLEDVPGVSTRISRYIDWISSKMEI